MCENCCCCCKHKKFFFGLFLLVFGFFWYLNETGYVIIEPFLPMAAMVIGFLIMLKGLCCGSTCECGKPEKSAKKK